MFKMKKILTLLVFSVFLFVACGDDEPDVECTVASFNTEINAAVTNLNNAIMAFNNDNSNANCDAVKAAAQDYFDAVKAYEDCAELQGPDYTAALAAAQDAVNSISC
jgi:hypothetical protein